MRIGAVGFRLHVYKDIVMSNSNVHAKNSGSCAPLGATHLGSGWWNFAIYSPRQVLRLALGSYETGQPTELIALDPATHRTGDIWHIRVQVREERFVWGWEIEPSSEIPSASRSRYALDPYALLLKTKNHWGKNAWKELSKGSDYLVCVAATETKFPWKSPVHTPLRPDPLVIYETHVRGWTKDPSSNVRHPGTYLGMIEKLPHLKAMGITAIELLPIYEFDESEWKLINPLTNERLFNYWGYSPLSFFAPMQRYGTTADPITTAREVKGFVEACHDQGIAVILDVVYNHTGEGNEHGPAYSLKQIDENTYYIMEKSAFANYSGCGNTLNANHPVVWRLVLDSLRHWACEYRIDGFRFDLASALTRSQTGEPMAEPPVVEAIINDPIVGRCLLIAEPWDAAGLHQTGQFSTLNQRRTPVFREWNDRFRDDVRRFIKGDEGLSGAFACRLCGSEDLFGFCGTPLQSINYINAHDGFSLYDLVSYQSKHNLANGEENRDGMNENASWNCGVEGPTEKQQVLRLRDRQIKNFLVALLFSQGIPMILSGDECHRTKLGNNNTWCQDTPVSWLNWAHVKANHELMTLIATLIKIRKESGCFAWNRFLTPDDIQWHGTKGQSPSWLPQNHLVACTLNDAAHKPRLFLAFNASHEAQEVEIPKHPTGGWRLLVDTAHPEEASQDAPRVTRHTLKMAPYSSAVLYCP